MEVYSSHILKIDYNPQKQLLTIKRYDLKNNEEYKESVLLIAGKIERYKPKKILVDLKDFSFPIHPEIQNWSTEIFTKLAIKIGVEKTAYLMTEDFATRIALENMIEEAKKSGVNILYTTSKEEAQKWLDI